MKFLYVTDTHLTGRGPSSRTDNYVDAIMEKFEEIRTAIQKESVEAVLHGGDLFDKPVVSMQLTGMVANFILSTGVPWYVVPGNHDLFGYNLNSLPQTSLGLLKESGVVHILDRKSGGLKYLLDNGKTLSIEGQEYHMDIDKREPEQDYFTTNSADMKILIPHSMLLDKDYFPGIPHTRTKDLAGKTDADLILVGHYHDGFTDRVVNKDKMLEIVNPGSMIRDEASKGNLKRRPKYVILDIQDQIHWSFHEFQCAAKGEDIFDRSHITEKQEKNRYLEAFEQKLDDTPVQATDIRTVLETIIKQSNDIDNAVSDESRKRLEEAEQELEDVSGKLSSYIEKPANIGIESVEIKGFQSHEDSLVEFGDGLNAIVGSSDSGKSAIIRALRFVLYNEPRGSDFIRTAATAAVVRVNFTDGSALTRSRTRSSSGSYIVHHPDGTETELKGFANNMPSDIANTHQMPQIRLAKDLETTLSVGYQLDGPFMIGESPGTRASIIGKLAGVDLVDQAVREINKEVLGKTRDVKSVNAEIEKMEESLESYQDLPELNKRIQQSESKLALLKEKESKKAQLISIDNGLQTVDGEIALLQATIRETDTVVRYSDKVNEAQRKLDRKQTISRIQTGFETVDRRVEKTKRILRRDDQTVQLEPRANRINDRLHDLQSYKTLSSELQSADAQISKLTSFIASLPDSSVEPRLEAVKKKQSLLEPLRKVLMEGQRSAKNIAIQKVELSKEEENLNRLNQDYDAILQEQGTCPVCKQTIVKGSHIHV